MVNMRRRIQRGAIILIPDTLAGSIDARCIPFPISTDHDRRIFRPTFRDLKELSVKYATAFKQNSISGMKRNPLNSKKTRKSAIRSQAIIRVITRSRTHIIGLRCVRHVRFCCFYSSISIAADLRSIAGV